MKSIKIPSGSIINVNAPNKKGSLKRWIMNAESRLVRKRYRFEELLNHTAIIEKDGSNILIWEAKVIGGVSATAIAQYPEDLDIIITGVQSEKNRRTGLSRFKAEAGKKYDFKSWWKHLWYIITGKWKGDTDFNHYSKEWFCSELTDHSFELTQTPYLSTPNHIYEATKHNQYWRGKFSEFVELINTGKIIIEA